MTAPRKLKALPPKKKVRKKAMSKTPKFDEAFDFGFSKDLF